MPLKWTPARNPYLHHAFGVLRLGPHAPPAAIEQQAKNLAQSLRAGGSVSCGGQPLDEHAIGEAAKSLRDPRSLAEELLLVHPQPKGGGDNVNKLVKRLREVSQPPPAPLLPALKSAASLAWFVSEPAPELASPPRWAELGLPGPDSSEDRALDIVFDS